MSTLKAFFQEKEFKVLDQPKPYENTLQIAEDNNGNPVFMDIDIAGVGPDKATPDANWFELNNGTDLEEALGVIVHQNQQETYTKAVNKLFKDTGINPIGPFQIRINVKK